MQELIVTLIATLQALTLLLVAQGNMTPELQTQINAINQTASITAVAAPKPLSFTTINQQKSPAVINILCRGSGNIRSGTASAVIISPTGLVLTNAHMAQYMLLEQATDAPVSCTIRTGSPAKAAYKARVLYISKDWVKENAHQISSREQLGTGKDDYAILQITESLSGSELPAVFPHILPNPSLATNTVGQQVLMRAYPAEFIGTTIALRALHSAATISTIKAVSTFTLPDSGKVASPDLISLGGTIIAQGGSSGGAVVDAQGQLVGIIVTSTRTEETKDRDLKAITLSHINASIKEETGISLAELIATPATELTTTFQEGLLASAYELAQELNK